MNLKTFTLGALVAAATFTAALAEPKTYAVDTQHMEVTYAINHLGFSTSKGRFSDVASTLTLDETNPTASKVTAVIQVASIDSGYTFRDNHLKTADFFDVAKYPTITFASTKVTKTGAKTAKVAGDLTIHGVTKPVVLDATIVGIGANPMSKAQEAGIHATTTVKRSDFGMTGYLPAIGDEVTITLDAEYLLK
jgi:polyisoprenoid-binding protein YceI